MSVFLRKQVALFKEVRVINRQSIKSGRIVQPLLLGVMLFALGGCALKEETESRDYQVLFEVNRIERTVYDFEKSYVEHLIATGRHDSKSERNAHLNKMIDDILLSQSAEANGLLDHEIYRSAVEHQERKSIIDVYFIDQMEQEIDPLTEDEIRLAYAKRQRKVYIRQLFSRDPADLDSAMQALETGESFVDVANQFYETTSYDSLAGYLGPISYFGVDDNVAEAAYSIPQGTYTELIRSRLGYHILFAERVEFPALLTEDDFQYRKQGVESQLRLRRQRLVSSEFVYNLMNQLDVEVNRENLLQLQNAINDLDSDAMINEEPLLESEERNWTDSRVSSLANQLDQDLVLATYTIDESPSVFTFGQYIDWLPYLSFQESKIRIGASVGRGMRNQVLLDKALSEDYAQDQRVKKALELRATDILSQLQQYQLTMEAVLDTQAVQVPETFRERLTSSKDIVLKAAYWKVNAGSLDEAQKIVQRLSEGADPATMDGYTSPASGVMDKNESDYNLVLKSVPQTPTVSYTADQGYFVLNVEQRSIEEVGISTNVSDLERSYKVYQAIRGEVDSLRREADIEINMELFREIYEVWSPTQKSGA
ncbi:MAG: peptidylprolyl isomerase [Bacteroidetes bacterium]|nr:peptidylprolyl isomerase [Bacteroidota bacterium]MDA0907261.1 peptidylprolyl isomerase [Bacteroidota bacterium]